MPEDDGTARQPEALPEGEETAREAESPSGSGEVARDPNPDPAERESALGAATKLRRKLGDDARNPGYILGERGLGYRMPEPDRV